MVRSRVAVAFGGGGARALGSLGAMKVIEEQYEIVAVSGTSMGSVIAAYYGVYGEVDSLRTWYESLSTRELLSLVSGPSKNALIGSNKLRELLYKWFGDLCLEDLPIPVYVVAASLSKKREVVFSSGKIVDCVLASFAIPGLFSPVRIGDEFFVDGGICNPTPINVLSCYENVIGIDFPSGIQEFKKTPTLFENIFVSYEVARDHAVSLSAQKKNVIIIRPESLTGIQILRFDKAREHIRLGEEAARKTLGA